MQTLTPLSTKAVQQARMRNAVKLIRTKYEDEIAAALQPFFRKQALSAAKSHRGEGQFRAEDWDEELINTVAPLLGKIFAKEMRKQVMEAVDVVSAKASHKLHFMKVFCPTGAGGGVDATCKPGGSGGGATGGGKLSGEGVKIAEKHKDDQAWKEPITEMMEAHGLKYEDYETVNDALYRHNIASGDASDKRLTDLWNGSSDASKAMKVMSAWNEWQTESKKWDPMDPEIAENVNKRLQFVKTDEDWKARQPFFTDGGYFKSADDYRKYLDDRVKGKRIYYRAGPLDKKAVSVTTDPEGARSGASSTHFIPDRLFTYEDMKSKGYRLLAGARGMVGVVSSKEREHILLKIDKNESKGYESRFETKSTASDYLSTFDTNALEENVFQTPMGNVSFDFVSEYPEWMKQDIVDYLHESFGEEYWLDINKTSAGTVDKILELGTQEGWSVNKVAREIVQQAGSPKFTLQRGKMIARTEMGHALNSARVRGMDAFMEQIGKELPMKKTWLSVLGTTTRDSHAHLDGVPANEKGVWEIAGVEARWPSDSRLPAGERINCQCTVVIDYGMTDEMAQAELADYFERIEEKAFKAAIKVFCPTGAGGGVVATCRRGGASAIPQPPKLTGKAASGKVGQKFSAIHAAGTSGSKSAVEAIKTNPNAKSPYPKKLHGYKVAVLRAMSQGGDIGPAPPKVDLPTVKDVSLPKTMSPGMKAAAKAGDLDGMVAKSKTAVDVVATKRVAEQLSPPPPAKDTAKVEGELEKVAGKATAAEMEKKAVAVKAVAIEAKVIPLPDNGVDIVADKKKFEEVVEKRKLAAAEMRAIRKDLKNAGKSEFKQAYKNLSLEKLEKDYELSQVHIEQYVLAHRKHAADPVSFEKAVREKYAYQDEGTRKSLDKFKEVMDDLPVEKSKYGDGFESFDPESFSGRGIFGGLKELPPGLSKADSAIFAEGKRRGSEWQNKEIESFNRNISKAYYGEAETVRSLPSNGLGPAEGLPSDKIKRGGAEPGISSFMGQAEILIQTKTYAISAIGESKKLKNGFQSGTSGVGKGKSGYRQTRKNHEEELHGIAQNTKAKDRPFYGYLEHPDRAISEGAQTGLNYGQVQMVMKPSVKSRSSYTVGDSLDDHGTYTRLTAGSVSDPIAMKESALFTQTPNEQRYRHHNVGASANTSQAFQAKLANQTEFSPVRYAEVQIHGPVTLSSIKEVRIVPGTPLSEKALKNFSDAGVAVRHVPPWLGLGSRSYSKWDQSLDEKG